MWNGAGSVSPAGKACDWVGPCHCESCVAKRGYVVQRTAESEAANVLTQERAEFISDLVEAQSRVALAKFELYQKRVSLYGELFAKYKENVEWHAAWARRVWSGL